MNFEFPDVADFPENDAPCFPEDIQTDHLFRDQFLFKEDTRTLRDLIEKTMKLDKAEIQILGKQINRATKAAREYFMLKLAEPRKDIKGGAIYDDLMDQGIWHTQADTALLRDMFAQRAKDLEHSEPKMGTAVYDRAIQDNSPQTIKTVQKFFDGMGVLEAATKYRGGANMKVKSVTLHVSKPGDRHHFQQFSDCETTTELLNLHMDPKPGILKSIIYLSDVTETDGPFKYIPGSPDWKTDEMERIFAWGNSTSNYCQSPTHRRVANAFPKRFRKNAIIGRLIPDGTPLSNKLRKLEVPYHSNVASCMVFSPTFGLHRGGQCTTGMRTNLQVVLS